MACTTPKLDHTPLLAIVGQQAMSGIGGSEQQVRHVIDRAARIASVIAP